MASDLLQGFITVPLGKLVPAPWNFKEEDEQKAAALVENLRRRGIIRNLNVRELDDGTYEVLDGNHRLMALRALGLPEDTPILVYNHGPLPQREAIALAHALIESFVVDIGKQSLVLQKLTVEGTLDLDDWAQTTPWSAEELDSVRSLGEFDWEVFTGAEEAPEEPPTAEETQITVKVTKEARENILQRLREVCERHHWPKSPEGLGLALYWVAQQSALTPEESLQ